MFVGDILVNVEGIKNVLRIVDPIEEYVDSCIEKCDVLKATDRFLSPLPYASFQNEKNFIVQLWLCLFGSLKKTQVKFCLDQCENLRKEMKASNSPYPDATTKLYQPWAVLCFLIGFQENGNHYTNVEDRLKFGN